MFGHLGTDKDHCGLKKSDDADAVCLQELPQNRLFWPPLTIRCIECRSFGRQLLVGVCNVDRLAVYEWKEDTTSDALTCPAPTNQMQVTEGGKCVCQFLLMRLDLKSEFVRGRFRVMTAYWSKFILSRGG